MTSTDDQEFLDWLQQRTTSTRRTGWRRTVAVHPEFHDPGLDFPTRRDAIVARLRDSGWPATNPAVADLVDQLARTGDEAEFDITWNEIYDTADADRTWIDTRGPLR